ncbi:MAG: SDR family oxidoreductase [Saprospiraceae bacterium]|nr:SDR family oxidoreductase [Saprospiraceae bacterium]
MEIKNKTVWITGASSGIGKACALAFSKRGCSLILSARNEEKLKEVKTLCIGAPSVHILPLDVKDHKTLGPKTAEAIKIAGHIDILVNNAGISQRCTVAGSELALDKEVMDVNFFGNVGLTRAILPHMKNRKTGAIVVTSSVAGKLGPPLRCAYAASKHALHGWYDVLRAEVAHNNIQVNVICPGYIKTDISINALAGDGKKHGTMDKGQAEGVSAERCAEHFIRAIEKNKRESFIGGKEVNFIKLRRFSPRLYFNMLQKMATKARN